MDTEGAYLNIIKAIYDKSIADIILSVEKPESISSKIRNKTRASTLTTVIQHSLEVLVMAIREEKEKRNSNWKRRSKTVTAEDMILYIENPNDATRKIISANQ